MTDSEAYAPVLTQVPLSKKEQKAAEKAQKLAEKQAAKQAKKQGKKGGKVAIIILTILCILLAGFGGVVVWQAMGLAGERNDGLAQIEDKDAKIAKLEASEKTLKEDAEKLEGQIAELEKTIADQKESLTDNEETYKALIEAMQMGDFGYGSETFCVDTNVVVLQKGKTEKLALTADVNSEAKVEVTYSGEKANVVTFDETSWNGNTTVTVEGKQAGVTVVTFANTADTAKFNVLVVVTE